MCVCVCVQVCCVRMQISVNKRSQKEKNLLSWWTQCTDVVCVDADGGRGHVGTWTHCMSMQMDCVQMQISVKKKRKEKKLTYRHVDVLRVHCMRKCWCADVDDRKKNGKKKKKTY